MIKITFGQITLEANAEEIPLALDILGKLQAMHQPASPANERKAAPLAFEKQSNGKGADYSKEQVENAALAIAKGYSFENSYKSIAGKNLKITGDEKGRFGFDREGIAKERLQAIADCIAGEPMQAGEHIEETSEETDDDDL